MAIRIRRVASNNSPNVEVTLPLALQHNMQLHCLIHVGKVTRLSALWVRMPVLPKRYTSARIVLRWPTTASQSPLSWRAGSLEIPPPCA